MDFERFDHHATVRRANFPSRNIPTPQKRDTVLDHNHHNHVTQLQQQIQI